MRGIHVITPGDHFSPSTGSAVPTVVDGLCRYAPEDQPKAAVAVARGTYADRYDSADILEYQPVGPMPRPVNRVSRYVDAALGRMTRPRPFARRSLKPIIVDQEQWPSSTVFAHNLPQLIPMVDADLHTPVLYVHNELLRSYTRAESRRALDRAHRVICVSGWLAERTMDHLPADVARRVRVVPNGVDTARFRRPQPLSRSGPLRVMFLGRMIPQKGAHVLVEAVRRLNREDIVLSLVGSSGFSEHDPLTAYERSLRSACQELGNKVSLTPFIPRADVVHRLHETDVLVVPSIGSEAFALTGLEGMAAGAAVIGSATGGIPDSLGSAGVLVPPDDPAALAEVLEAFADDEGLLRRIAAAGQSHAESHDWRWASAKLQAALET